MQYDGSINISTKIDTQGINKGTKSISSSLGGVLRSVMMVAKAMAAAFIGGSIISGIRSLMGQFDLMGSSIGASVKQLSTSFDALKGAFVNLILTALTPLIPYVITFVQWLTRLLNIATQIIGALAGIKAGFGGVTSATKKASKGALAAFDQINVLQTSDKGGNGLPPVDPISPELLAKLEEFKAKAAEFFRPLTEALGRLYEALKPLGETIWAGLKWAWDNILVPLGTWVVSDLLPAFLDLLAGALDVLNEVLIALGPLAVAFWENFLKPLGNFVGSALIAFLEFLAEKLRELAEWIRENPEKFQEFATILGVIGLAISAIAALILIALNPFALLVAVIAAVVAIMLNLGGVLEWVKLVIGEMLKDLQKLFDNLASYILTTFFDVIGNRLASALDNLFDKFTSVFGNIKSFVYNTLNSIIDYINGMINAFVGGLNVVMVGVGAISGMVGGVSQAVLIPNVQIPRLATGAVIPPNAEFAAILGDQKSGMNIETPVNLMRQTFEDALSRALANQNVTIRFTGAGADIARMLKPELDRENRRVGGSLIRGGV
jgi:hypothetical protein